MHMLIIQLNWDVNYEVVPAFPAGGAFSFAFAPFIVVPNIAKSKLRTQLSQTSSQQLNLCTWNCLCLMYIALYCTSPIKARVENWLGDARNIFDPLQLLKEFSLAYNIYSFLVTASNLIHSNVASDNYPQYFEVIKYALQKCGFWIQNFRTQIVGMSCTTSHNVSVFHNRGLKPHCIMRLEKQVFHWDTYPRLSLSPGYVEGPRIKIQVPPNPSRPPSGLPGQLPTTVPLEKVSPVGLRMLERGRRMPGWTHCRRPDNIRGRYLQKSRTNGRAVTGRSVSTKGILFSPYGD